MPEQVIVSSVPDSFHAKVIVARLAAEGIRARLVGLDEGPYRLPGVVDVLVDTADAALAREVLLADAVDAAFDEPAPPPRRSASRWRFRRRAAS